MRKTFPCFVLWLLGAVLGLPARSVAQLPLELHYHLTLARPTSHLVGVQIDAGRVHEPTLDFVMPAWSPGRYAIYDFAKNVQEFEATSARGEPLPWTKLDKQTWRVETYRAEGAVRVRYRVYGNDLSGSFSQFDSSHASLSGASVYIYVAGHKQDPITLSVDELPASNPPWKIVSGFSLSTADRTFLSPNYDVLVDTPMEISPECSVSQFQERGKTFRVAVHNYAEEAGEIPKLEAGLEGIVRSELAMMPDPDFASYTFIIHFAPELSIGDGMEHLNSCQIVIRGKPSGEGLRETLLTAAHEFFHLWNVKRLRPAALGPFNYARENYTPSLWFAEGVTSYYAYVHTFRSGLETRQEFLKQLADEIRALEFEPGRSLMSAESSSFDAWFFDRPPQAQETNFPNSTISYYNKGAVLGLLLDLEIRGRTEGRKSLDDVMQLLYRKFYESLSATRGGSDPSQPSFMRGRSYGERDILEAVNAVSGSDFRTFFERYVRGTEPLPYARSLALAGMQFKIDTAPDSTPVLGVLTRRESRGLRIVAVRPASAADNGGLAQGDLLLNVDELPLSDTELKDRLRMYLPGTEVPVTIERHGRQERITVALDPPPKDLYSIVELPQATPQQVYVRNGWLTSK